MELKYISQYLDNMNRYIFTKMYKKLNLYISGFGVIEKKYLYSPNHYHIVINDNNNVLPYKKSMIKDIHYKSLDKVKSLPKQTDIQDVYYQDNLVSYILKDITTPDSLFTIGKEGII
jgi:hypothetical protein